MGKIHFREKSKKQQNFIKEGQRGITLIALIVTIIVLILLAGVAIMMLRGDNGILNRASEAKYTNVISGFDEQVKLASMSVRTSIEANKVSKAGYIATKAENTKALADEVAKGLGLTEAILANVSNTEKAETEGYTVAYYLDTEGNETTNGNTYIVIWYTDNSLRSTLNRAEISKYGLKDVAKNNTSINQAMLVSVIHIENYNSELFQNGITSTTDADIDIAKNNLSETTIIEKGLNTVVAGTNDGTAGSGGSGSGNTGTHIPVDASAYGKKVTNYTVGGDWEVFYDGAVAEGGESRIYLIKTAATSNEALSISGYSGTSDFTDSTKLANYPAVIQGLLYKTKPKGTATNDVIYSSSYNNMRATQFLLDSSLDKWKAYLDYTNSNKTATTYGDYVIGGPTLELLVASYNATKTNEEEKVTISDLGVYGYAKTISSGLTNNNNGSNP